MMTILIWPGRVAGQTRERQMLRKHSSYIYTYSTSICRCVCYHKYQASYMEATTGPRSRCAGLNSPFVYIREGELLLILYIWEIRANSHDSGLLFHRSLPSSSPIPSYCRIKLTTTTSAITTYPCACIMDPADLPKTMKTLLQVSRRSTEVIVKTVPVPIPSHPEDVLVRVHAAAPCAGELRWAMDFPDAIPADKELVPCQDLAGSVVLAPPDSGFAPGDRVFCRISAERAGAARDYALARVGELAKVPVGLGWIEAAATPLSALTAWQALFVQGTLFSAGIDGDAEAQERNAKARVLVTGAAGGVGSWVVQLAARAGAKHIVAVCGPGKEGAVRQLGATEVVNYQQSSIEEWVAINAAARECDLVIDVVGGRTLVGCWAAVRADGALISINTPPDMVKPADLDKKLTKSLFFIVEPLGSNLARIGELIRAGKVRPVIDSVWAFGEYNKAFEKLESGHSRGKIVIKVDGEAEGEAVDGIGSFSPC
ncbi:hypothetical protein QBC46DRAFT_375061 [Diplogelasinospora grovesii]|uniref:Enoyl reductase (ER) domain-containing protein n=1 Tax=Diplogelasinospora grovesii TaxID=303347 RepID=A0AAN6NF63_9PEZI|nr:hypothetical protein QBC46DRAFT_375061 [Diplogelasinospora grovesii]